MFTQAQPFFLCLHLFSSVGGSMPTVVTKLLINEWINE